MQEAPLRHSGSLSSERKLRSFEDIEAEGRDGAAIQTDPVDVIRNHPHVQAVTRPRGCCALAEYYMLDQAVAVVRHAERLDQTPEWWTYPGREAWPNDTPLAQVGHVQAAEVGEKLFEKAEAENRPWQLIVSSPYLRCAQSASHIGRRLRLPVRLDQDLGEVFDEELSADGTQQNRTTEELDAYLKRDFPDVEYLRDEEGQLQIRGTLPRHPEALRTARLRFCHKVQLLVQRASAMLSSIIVVTHADALAASVSLLRPSWCLTYIPPAAYYIATRMVRVMDKRSANIYNSEPMYTNVEQWSLEVAPGLRVRNSASYIRRNNGDLSMLEKDVKRRSDERSENGSEHDEDADLVSPVTAEGLRTPRSSPSSNSVVSDLLSPSAMTKKALANLGSSSEAVDRLWTVVTQSQAFRNLRRMGTRPSPRAQRDGRLLEVSLLYEFATMDSPLQARSSTSLGTSTTFTSIKVRGESELSVGYLENELGEIASQERTPLGEARSIEVSAGDSDRDESLSGLYDILEVFDVSGDEALARPTKLKAIFGVTSDRSSRGRSTWKPMVSKAALHQPLLTHGVDAILDHRAVGCNALFCGAS